MKIYGKKRRRKKSYSDLSDTEKLISNWKKTRGLFQRREYSGAVVRAGTCVEIAANILIRAELVEKRNLESSFVDSLMRWANGLKGKYHHLIIPVLQNDAKLSEIENLLTYIDAVNAHRNQVAHTGAFKTKTEACAVISNAYEFLSTILQLYEPSAHIPNFSVPL